MPVPFGFSVSDFVTGIELIHELGEALKDVKGSEVDYVNLICALHSLEGALLALKGLPQDSMSQAQLDAIDQVMVQCSTIIMKFLQPNKKFRLPLTFHGSGNKPKDSIHRLQWQVNHKDDIMTLQAYLQSARRTLNMLALTVQMEAARKSSSISGNQNGGLTLRVNGAVRLPITITNTLQSNVTAPEEIFLEPMRNPMELAELLEHEANEQTERSSLRLEEEINEFIGNDNLLRTHQLQRDHIHEVIVLQPPVYRLRLFRPCLVLIYLGTIFVSVSLGIALWWSIAHSDPSGGFTMSAYVLGIGAFIIVPVQTQHNKSCQCWNRGDSGTST